MLSLTQLSQQVQEAHQRLQQASTPPRRTDLEFNPRLSAMLNAQVYLKFEHMQHTGSFKYRGALHRILMLSDKQKQAGVITASSGNHGMACAMAAQQSLVGLQVLVPENASGLKVAKIESYGASVIKVRGDCLAAEIEAGKIAVQEGKTYISPYNDEQVMAGQGTVGVELYEQAPDLDAVFIAVGGGGLIGGTAAYLKNINPAIEVYGCWPRNAPAMARCIDAREIIEVEESATLSDGTAGGVEPGAITFDVCRQVIDHKVLVDEHDIAEQLAEMVKHERMIVEGAAAVALAALKQYKQQVQGKKVAVVLCGRNIALDTLKSVLE